MEAKEICQKPDVEKKQKMKSLQEPRDQLKPDQPATRTLIGN